MIRKNVLSVGAVAALAVPVSTAAASSWFSVTNVSFPWPTNVPGDYHFVTHAGGGNAVPTTASYRLNIGARSIGGWDDRVEARVTASVQGGDAFGRVAVHARHTFLENPQDGNAIGNQANITLTGATTMTVVSDRWVLSGTRVRNSVSRLPVVGRRLGEQITLAAWAYDNNISSNIGPAVQGFMYALTPSSVSLNSMSGGLSVPTTLDTSGPVSLAGTLASQFARPDIAFEFGSVPSPFRDDISVMADVVVNNVVVQSGSVGSTQFVGGDVFHSPWNVGDTLRNIGGSLNFANLDLSALPLGETTIELRLRALHTPRGGTIEPTLQLGSASYSYTTTLIPTPGAAALLGVGGLLASRRRRSRSVVA